MPQWLCVWFQHTSNGEARQQMKVLSGNHFRWQTGVDHERVGTVVRLFPAVHILR